MAREQFRTGDDIRALLRRLPARNEAAIANVRAREAELTKPEGSLGRLERLVEWLAGWQGRARPALGQVHVLVFAGNHGVAVRGVSAYPAEVTVQMVANFRNGGAAVNQLSRWAGAELTVTPLQLDRPTADLVAGAAMSEAEMLEAFAAGFAALPADADLVCVGEMGIGNTTSAAALCQGLFGGVASDWVGTGTGLDGAGLARKIEVVEAATARHAGAAPLGLLARLGGREIAAMAGAILAARLKPVPVLLDGYVCGAAAAVLHALEPRTLEHVQAAHRSAEPGHGRLLAALGLEPLLDLGMRLGEGSGAALAVGLVRAALTTHLGMATFAEAGVAGRGD